MHRTRIDNVKVFENTSADNAQHCHGRAGPNTVPFLLRGRVADTLTKVGTMNTRWCDIFAVLMVFVGACDREPSPPAQPPKPMQPGNVTALETTPKSSYSFDGLQWGMSSQDAILALSRGGAWRSDDVAPTMDVGRGITCYTMRCTFASTLMNIFLYVREDRLIKVSLVDNPFGEKDPKYCIMVMERVATELQRQHGPPKYSQRKVEASASDGEAAALLRGQLNYGIAWPRAADGSSLYAGVDREGYCEVHIDFEAKEWSANRR